MHFTNHLHCLGSDPHLIPNMSQRGESKLNQKDLAALEKSLSLVERVDLVTELH